jgi:tetratricopeptide (TPR) repeat protein
VLHMLLAPALRSAGRQEESIAENRRAIQLNPDALPAHLDLACDLSLMGRDREARSEAAEVLRINPNFSLDYWYAHSMLTNDQSVRDRRYAAWLKAGLK